MKAYHIPLPHWDATLILVADLVADSPHIWGIDGPRERLIPVQMVSTFHCRPPYLDGQRGTGASNADADTVHNSHLVELVAGDDHLQATVYLGELGGQGGVEEGSAGYHCRTEDR